MSAAQKDAVLQASIDFIGSLTGMKPPPIEVAPPEVFAPFKEFTDKVCAIFAAHQTNEIAQEVEPVAIIAVAPNMGAVVGWLNGYVAKHNDKLYTAPQAVNAELLAACKAMIAWDDAENDATVYAEDGGAHWRMRQALCADAFGKARAAIAKAVEA